uniref:Uncharacterized protein n=1 Tax=Myotis myotis TaxID=51298 RepID=A0A7J7T5L4_MYOMY|nr:hypothetical protein mMyoMyo1_009128 [Myotis myotis]
MRPGGSHLLVLVWGWLSLPPHSGLPASASVPTSVPSPLPEASGNCPLLAPSPACPEAAALWLLWGLLAWLGSLPCASASGSSSCQPWGRAGAHPGATGQHFLPLLLPPPPRPSPQQGGALPDNTQLYVNILP